MAPTRRRVTIELTRDCNNACVFCAQTGLPAREILGDTLASALSAARSSADELTFVGGEPTLREDLPAVVTAARTAGFRRVGIQTNARRLADRTYVHALVQAGLTDVHTSLHGPSAVHDYHTGIQGSYGHTATGLATAAAAGLTVVATTVLTRSNYQTLEGLPGVLATRGASAWMVALPHAAGRARTGFDRLMPRLGLTLRYALHALQTARAARLIVWISGAPLCLLGPHAGHVLPGTPRAYGKMCEGCAARPMCPGVNPAYLARFAGDELAPRAAPPGPAYVGDRADALARMFVGVGALATEPVNEQPVNEQPVNEVGTSGVSPTRARVALPLVAGG